MDDELARVDVENPTLGDSGARIQTRFGSQIEGKRRV